MEIAQREKPMTPPARNAALNEAVQPASPSFLAETAVRALA